MLPDGIDESRGALRDVEFLVAIPSLSFTRRLGRKGDETRPGSVPGTGVTGEEGIGVCGRGGTFFTGARSTNGVVLGSWPGDD